MTSRPRLDAVLAWRADPTTEVAWPVPDFDPTDGLNNEERVELAIANCSSGAQAELPVDARGPVIDVLMVAPPSPSLRRLASTTKARMVTTARNYISQRKARP